MFVVFHHAIQDGKEFPHTGGERQLLRFASRQQALVKLPNDRVQRVATNAPIYSVARTAALPPQTVRRPAVGTTVPAERSQPDQRGDLVPAQCAQFRQIGQQRHRYPANPRRALSATGRLSRATLDFVGCGRSGRRPDCCVPARAKRCGPVYRDGPQRRHDSGGSSRQSAWSTPAGGAPPARPGPGCRHPAGDEWVDELPRRSGPISERPSDRSRPTGRWTWQNRAPAGG